MVGINNWELDIDRKSVVHEEFALALEASGAEYAIRQWMSASEIVWR